MKGAILSVAPNSNIVDLTHEIPPHDINAAARTLLALYPAFPPRTIHVAVVDPGVGSSRRPILIAGDQYLVGPDNGLFTYILELEKASRIFHLNRQEHFRHPVSPTFHGRDVFAPIAGALANGVDPAELGTRLTDVVRLPPSGPRRTDERTIEASVINVDRFGNCQTNISREDLTDDMIARGAYLLIQGREINSFRRFFSEGESLPGELFAIWGSAGLLEIAAYLGSASRELKIERWHSFIVRLH